MSTLKFVGLFWLFILAACCIWHGLASTYKHSRGDYLFVSLGGEWVFFAMNIGIASAGAALLHFVFT